MSSPTVRRTAARLTAAALACWIALSAPGAHAQETPPPDPGARQHTGAIWIGLMTDWQINRRWSIWFDTHYDNRAFFVLRPGLSYTFAAGPVLTGGYAYALTDPGDGSLTRQEHRPWAQLVLPAKFGDDWGFSERLRAELRFRQKTESGQIVDGWIAVPRFRAQTALTYSLVKASYGEWFLQPAIELLVNAGDQVGTNFLDQTRASLMVGFRRKPFTIRVGYMDRFLPSASPPMHEHDFLLWLNYAFEAAPAEAKADPAPVDPHPEGQNP
ncbi:MAG TPA: DUF2490 domain-containing protein [Polyangiaceae bacterium]|nr:DUF2490 domain-containing protein [Polyangiaceae bacterium]